MPDIIQRSDDWFAVRLGKVTASRVADVVAKTKTGWGASRANYKAQLVCERLTGFVEPSYTNAAMQWGIDKEDEARAAYQIHALCEVAEIGFIDHPHIEMAGCSPDGLVGADGLVEVKCPMSAAHIETLLGQSVPAKYICQVQWQMACADRAWCDFVSYDPRLPDAMRLFVERVHRDDVLIKSLEQDVSDFLAEVDATVAELRAKYECESIAA